MQNTTQGYRWLIKLRQYKWVFSRWGKVDGARRVVALQTAVDNQSINIIAVLIAEPLQG